MQATEKTQLLAGLLKTQCGEPTAQWPYPDVAETANMEWAANHFFFTLLSFSKTPPRPTLAAFEVCATKFFTETGLSIDTESLISRHWARRFGGEIQIAEQIGHLFFHYRDFGKDQPKPDFWEKYEPEIRFLAYFNEKYPQEGAYPTVGKDKFLELADKHRALFPKMPDWKNPGEENEWFAEMPGGEIALKFPVNYQNRAFQNELATHLWKDLLEKNEGHDPAELLFEWESIALKNRIWPSGFLQKLPFEAREKFVAAIFQRIENEDDLMHPEQEIQKAVLDRPSFDRGNFSPDALPDFPLRGSGFFEVFREIEFWEGIFHDCFFHQSARAGLHFFLSEILALETVGKPETWNSGYLKNTQRLLDFCGQRPAMFFTFCNLALRKFPEILPVFFRAPPTMSLGCLLLRDLKIRPEILPERPADHELPEEEIRSRIFEIAFETALARLARQSNAQQSGKIVCESLLPLAEKMFAQQGVKSRSFSVANELGQRFKNAWDLVHANSTRPGGGILRTPGEMSEFTLGFLDCLKSRPVLPAWSELVHLNLPVLAMLVSLLRLVRSARKSFANGGADLEKLESEIAGELVVFYQKEFSQRQIEVLKLGQNAVESRPAQWFQEPDFLDFFDFEPFLNLDTDLLEKLLDAVRPDNFEKCQPPETWPDEERHTWRPVFDPQFQREMLRFRVHFRFVLRIYRALFSKNGGAQRDEGWESAEAEIRKRLQKWAKFSRNDVELGLFDVFDPLLENHGSAQRLLPLLAHDVAQAVNFFPEKKRIVFVETLTKGVSRLDFLLKIFNEIEDDTCRRHIVQVVQNIDAESFIKNQSSWDTIETALVEATNAEPFVAIAERLLAYVRQNGKRRGTFFGLEFSRFMLEIELVLAYRKGERSLADLAVKHFESEKGKSDDPEIRQRRAFFEAMFLMNEKDFGAAAEIFERLVREVGSIEIHYRKLLNAVSGALHETEERQAAPQILEAWEDWQSFDSALPNRNGLEKFREGILFCRMAWLNAREDDAEFDFYKSQLSRNTLFEADVLLLVLKNYARRGMDLAASDLFYEARRAAAGDKKRLEELETFRSWFNPEAKRKAIEKFFGDLAAQPLEELVQVVPKLEHRHRSVPGFLLSEFLHIAGEMLQKITAVRKIELENPYNDLFTALLRARLSYLGFEVSDQAREGVSAAGKDAGELDLTVRFGSKEIAVYEAFILHEEERTVKHLFKVFRYAPVTRLFFIVVFYAGKTEKLADAFEEYKGIVEKMAFPLNCALQNGFEKAEGFQDSRNVFLGKTTHGSGESACTMFHLFLNLSY